MLGRRSGMMKTPKVLNVFTAVLMAMVFLSADGNADTNRFVVLAPTSSNTVEGTDYVYVPHSSQFLVPSFTVEAWLLRTTDSSGMTYIFNKGRDVLSGSILFARSGSATPQLVFVVQGAVQGAVSVADNSVTGQWYHVAGVYSASSGAMAIYCNGLLAGATNKLGFQTPTSTSPVMIGFQNDSFWNYPWHGYIDEVRFWNYARSQAEIQSTMCSKIAGFVNGLVANWNFDNGTANDATGNGHNGTLQGGARIMVGALPYVDPDDKGFVLTVAQ